MKLLLAATASAPGIRIDDLAVQSAMRRLIGFAIVAAGLLLLVVQGLPKA